MPLRRYPHVPDVSGCCLSAWAQPAVQSVPSTCLLVRPSPLPAAQSRPNIFDLEIRAPDVLYDMVVECDEQVVLPLGDTPGT